MDPLQKVACDAIDIEAARLNDISNELWHFKELGFEEHKSHAAITQFLVDRGFRMERHYKMETAFVARFGSTENKEQSDGSKLPHIAFLCEYDALPEIGHACGHNLIAELGLAAGIGVKAAMDQSGECLGQISIIGTPAEEGGGGKITLLEAGVFDDVDVAMMAHPAPFSDSRPVFLGGKRFHVNYKGKASHAAGFPWEGVNALDGAVLGYMNIAALRQQLRPTWRVHTIVTKGGTRSNIIPAEAELLVHIRAPRDSELDELEAKVKRCLNASAEAAGCEVDYLYSKKPYTCLVTNETLASLYDKSGTYIGKEITNGHPDKALGSTDMGNVSHVVPSLHPCYDIGTLAYNHTHGFADASASPSAQGPTLDQGKMLAMVALEILQKPQLLKRIREDFETDIKNL